MPVVIRGDLAGLRASERNRLVTSAFEEGVRGLDVSFETVPAERAPDERLVVHFAAENYTSNRPCVTGDGPVPEPDPAGARVVAAFCNGDQAVASTTGVLSDPEERARRRLLWRMAQGLFPDDYAETYGLGLLPDWLGLGVGGSFGF
ncbi:MAG: hypothetical protein R3349_06235 [Geminicoccaceae bacterium]|nr:hypothetical protein [Geminicoccaceae bacterium]